MSFAYIMNFLVSSDFYKIAIFGFQSVILIEDLNFRVRPQTGTYFFLGGPIFRLEGIGLINNTYDLSGTLKAKVSVPFI